MKKGLLIAASLLFVLGANAQALQRAKKVAPKFEKQQLIKATPATQVRTAIKNPNAPVRPMAKAPRKSVNEYSIGYYRPAGAFYSISVFEDGLYSGSYKAPYLMMKPYTDYTFLGYATAGSEATTYSWRAQIYDDTAEKRVWVEGTGNPITIQYAVESDSVPIMTATDGAQSASYFLRGFEMDNPSKPIIKNTYSGHILSVPDPQILAEDPATEERHISTAHFMGSGNRRGTEYYSRSVYHGAAPYDAEGEEGSGFWFGKNGQGIDGAATVFEKPTAPYALHGVAISFSPENTTFADSASANLTVKVYKLDAMQPYSDEASVELDAEPGELIAMGNIELNAAIAEESKGSVICNLVWVDEDGLEYEIVPTIDFPIMVTLEGYNDPENEGLTNFTLAVSQDEEDEGFGEQTYLKRRQQDGTYIWEGINNFFIADAETRAPLAMKVGITIGIDARMPFMVYNYNVEDGEFAFPVEGGSYYKEFTLSDGSTLELNEIQIFNYYVPSDGGDSWDVTLEDGGALPEWLHLSFEDGEDEDGEFNGLTKVYAEADALPENIKGRKADVKFAIPGAYLVYHFTQGEIFKTGDINGDNAVDVADLSLIIDVVLGKKASDDPEIKGDLHVSGGTGVDVADVSALIDIMLGK